jgi:hypothetical protein
MKTINFIGIIILSCIISCEKAPDQLKNNPIQLDYTELFNDSIPPCLRGINEIVIKTHSDYDSLRRKHAPQGEYENFKGDGKQKSFKLSYQPLGSDSDGKIGPNDLVIYVKNIPIIININNEEIEVSSNPFRIKNDSILIFADEHPYTVKFKIHYTKIFSVNSENGEITFVSPPLSGSDIWICGVRKLYDIYGNRVCTLDDFDLTDKIIIGNSIGGNGCLMGFDIELLFDTITRDLLYKTIIKIQYTDYGCPEIFMSYTKWILVENIKEVNSVNFKYDTLWVD